MKTLYKANSQRVSITVLDSSKKIVTGATVTANLVDGSLADVGGATALSMTETSDAGTYSVVIPNTFDPPEGTSYTFQISASSSGRFLYGETAVQVKKRTIP